MNWRGSQAECRQQVLKTYNTEEVETYERWIISLSSDDDRACLQDIETAFSFKQGMRVLDVGAGTGAMCKTLVGLGGLELFALEPVPAINAKLQAKPELSCVQVSQGFCDSPDDRSVFADGAFDVIVSRQLMNGLFDPLAAFHNWLHWLKPGGTVIAMDGLYDRNAWTGALEPLVDKLPMSACRSIAMAPYLLERAGFRIHHVGWMPATNARPGTRTQRYMVVAAKPQ